MTNIDTAIRHAWVPLLFSGIGIAGIYCIAKRS
jgi:hypothetical protein